MQALVFTNSVPRIVLTRILGALASRAYVGPTAPIGLREIPTPVLPADDWVVIRATLCGICGSDHKQVFLDGNLDNPLTALITFPQVPGHEVVGTVEEIGPAVRRRQVGERVVLNPWLSCAPRGLPPCEWCRRGELAQCRSFTRGTLAAGLHAGTSRDATGGFAPLVPAHETQCIPVPDGVSDEATVLADPFAVSLHAVLREPPPPGGAVLVYGCGTLGLLSVSILRLLHPGVRVLAVARHPHQGRLAAELGAETVVEESRSSTIIERIASALDVEIQKPWWGLPMLNGGVDVIYDSVGSAVTMEVGVRVTRPRGRIVVTGVAAPDRFEWTPLYFKEIALIGSNAFAVEEHDGRRQHAMEWYFEFLQTRGLDVTPIITHRYALEDYARAFLALHDKRASGAVKVIFDHCRRSSDGRLRVAPGARPGRS
jgi:threonine dehydrogenase-like Zn-dependent dehydrogenase